MNFHDTQIRNKIGEYESSSKYNGKVVLVVNTASKCGLTPQFEQLESLYQKYKDSGLEIIGIPSNSFKQESNDAIQAEQECKLNYGVTFKMMDVVDVNGKDEAPVYTFLKAETKKLFRPSMIKWNFEKFLITKDGQVYKRYAPTTNPLSLESDIKQLLEK